MWNKQGIVLENSDHTKKVEARSNRKRLELSVSGNYFSDGNVWTKNSYHSKTQRQEFHSVSHSSK